MATRNLIGLEGGSTKTIGINDLADIAGSLKVGGDLTVVGDIVSGGATNVVIKDPMIDLGIGASGDQVTGFSFAVSNGSANTTFSAINASTRVITVASETGFAIDDVVMISGSSDAANDGLYYISAVSTGSITLDNTALAKAPFLQTALSSTTSGETTGNIRQVDLKVLAVADGATLLDSGGIAYTAGTMLQAYYADAAASDFTGSGSYSKLVPDASAVGLQSAYETTPTITTASATNIAFTLTDGNFIVEDGTVGFGQNTALTSFLVQASDTTEAINLDASALNASVFISNQGGTVAEFANSSVEYFGRLNGGGSAGRLYRQTTTNGDDFKIMLDTNGTGSVASSLIIESEGSGTGVNGALKIQTVTNGGSIDINSVAGVTIDAAATSNFTVDGAGLTLSTTTSGNIDITSVGTFSIDGTGASNVTADTGNLTLSTTTSGNIDITAAGTFSIDGTGASNVTADTGNLTLSTTTSGNIDITSVGTFSIDGTGASNVTADTGNLTLSTTTSGNIDITSVGTFSIDGTGASNVTADTGNLTLSTTTSGTLILNSAAGATLDSTTLSIDSTDTTNLTMSANDGADKLLTIKASNANAAGNAYIFLDGVLGEGSGGTASPVKLDGANGTSIATSTPADIVSGVNQFDLVYMSASGFDQADANALSTALVCAVSYSDASAGTVSEGLVATAGQVVAMNVAGTPSLGDRLFLSATTAGQATTSAPGGSGDVIFQVGFVANATAIAPGIYSVIFQPQYIAEIA